MSYVIVNPDFQPTDDVTAKLIYYIYMKRKQ